ncbi:transcription regulator [Actinidia rufa]|uniref:Transcription regulator n=1 Tax=Actinidia rufa TaxID=165716 RepID=A0A7J0DD40_9ERIC|nr:transcription regulator [Actinidia rufa]
MYPDYDFSAVNAHQFFTEESWDSFKQIFDAYMFEASKDWFEANEGSTLLDTLYKALDEVVKLAECEVYSYFPDSDADPFWERGAINLVAEGFLTDGIGYEEDGEIFDEMDM